MLHFESRAIDHFWRRACTSMAVREDTPHWAYTFAEVRNNDPAIRVKVDALSDQAVTGEKRGTAHLLMQFEKDNVPMRKPGDYWVVLKTDGTPVCVVRLIRMEIAPFNQVNAVFAASEGEGDMTLETWRSSHQRYFQRQCERWGATWSEDLPVVCESFIRVYRP